jgi:ABC-type lipoprotein release transport system permease subunit
MRWWRELFFILDRLIHRRRAERELDEEISVHRELEIEGLAIALAVTRLLSSLLYGISSADPLTYVAVSVFVALVVVSAFYIPARKATKINPLDALRYE